jgi:hypothetical protein
MKAFSGKAVPTEHALELDPRKEAGLPQKMRQINNSHALGCARRAALR